MPSSQLLSLTVRGLGVISDVTLDFDQGFTVITGETGAGKTLLVDALSLCLGGESRSPRRGDELNVIALFEGSSGQEFSLQRSVSSSQRLRAVIDGAPTSSEALRALGDTLLVIHGQHDSLRLKSKTEILKMIDVFGEIDASQLESMRQRLSDLLRQRDLLGGSSSERERQLDFARFEVAEIEAARILGETELDDSLNELVALTALRDEFENVQTLISQGESDGTLDQFASIVAAMSQAGDLGLARRRILDNVSAIREEFHALSNMMDSDRLDDARFGELEARVNLLRNLARKYGGSLRDVLEAAKRAKVTISSLENAEGLAGEIEGHIAVVEQEIEVESSKILNLRRKAAQILEDEVRFQLPRVALLNAAVQYQVSGVDGSDVELMFTPNPGAPGGPIQNIASGGELSRVLLALSLVTSSDGLVTVFDEIDSGIGGNVAESIGDCLAALSTTRQVIAVTHLASVAARADHHFVVEKHVVGSETKTTIRSVSGSERVSEIARMLAGGSATTESRALAERLLGREPATGPNDR